MLLFVVVVCCCCCCCCYVGCIVVDVVFLLFFSLCLLFVGNVIVYDAKKITAPFVTPGKQNIYVSYPNSSASTYLIQEGMKVVESSMQEFIDYGGHLAKTDVG